MRAPILAAGLLLGWTLAARAAEERPPFVFPADLRALAALWGDGEDLLLLSDGAALYEVRRGEPPVRQPVPAVPSGWLRASGAGTGGAAVLAACSPGGDVARRAEGRWQWSRPPGVSADAGAAQPRLKLECAVDASGQVIVVLDGVLHRWDGARWDRDAPAGNRLWGMSPGEDGVYLLDNGGVWLLRHGARRPLVFPWATLDPRSRRPQQAWYSAPTLTLWTGSAYPELLAYDIHAGDVLRHPLLRPGEADSVAAYRPAGLDTADGEVLAAILSGDGDHGRAMVLDRRFGQSGVHPLSQSSDVRDLFLSARERAAYVLTPTRLQVVPLSPEGPGVEPPRPLLALAPPPPPVAPPAGRIEKDRAAPPPRAQRPRPGTAPAPARAPAGDFRRYLGTVVLLPCAAIQLGFVGDAIDRGLNPDHRVATFEVALMVPQLLLTGYLVGTEMVRQDRYTPRFVGQLFPAFLGAAAMLGHGIWALRRSDPGGSPPPMMLSVPGRF